MYTNSSRSYLKMASGTPRRTNGTPWRTGGTPTAEYSHGTTDNTEVFFGMMRALGIDANKNKK